MATSVCSRRIRSAAGLDGFADSGAVFSSTSYRGSGTSNSSVAGEGGWNCWGGGRGSQSYGGSTCASGSGSGSGTTSDEEGEAPPPGVRTLSRTSSRNLAATAGNSPRVGPVDYTAAVGSHHLSPPRFELHADGGALRQASCRNACGSRPDSPYGLLPGDAPREIPPPLFGAAIAGGICGGDAGLLSSRGPSRTSSQTLQGLKETHSVTLTEEVEDYYLSPDIPLIYVSCISTIVLLYFILFFDCRALARMVFPVYVDELHYHSMTKLETGLNVTASILLAFFVWLLHALLFDVAGMLAGVVPSAVTFYAVFSYRVMHSSPVYLVAALVAVASGFAAARSLEALLRRRRYLEKLDAHMSR